MCVPLRFIPWNDNSNSTIFEKSRILSSFMVKTIRRHISAKAEWSMCTSTVGASCMCFRRLGLHRYVIKIITRPGCVSSLSSLLWWNLITLAISTHTALTQAAQRHKCKHAAEQLETRRRHSRCRWTCIKRFWHENHSKYGHGHVARARSTEQTSVGWRRPHTEHIAHNIQSDFKTKFSHTHTLAHTNWSSEKVKTKLYIVISYN